MFDAYGSLGGMLILFVITTIIGIIYQFVLRSWFYFNDRNVAFIRGLPLLGSVYKSVIGFEPIAISYRRLYEHFPNEKFIGIYDLGGRPSYLIRDPDLIKQLLITDNEYFVDAKFENDLFAHALFGMRASKWYRKRSTVNPIISANQMRMMHSLMVKTSEQFIETLKKTDKIAKIFDSRKLFTHYANDVIAATAFNIKINSMDDVNNEFFKAATTMNEFRCIDGFKYLANISFPSLVKLLDVHVLAEKNANCIRKIIKENIDARKIQNITQNDMIDVLIKAQNGQCNDRSTENKINIGYVTTFESSSSSSSAVGKSNEKFAQSKFSV